MEIKACKICSGSMKVTVKCCLVLVHQKQINDTRFFKILYYNIFHVDLVHIICLLNVLATTKSSPPSILDAHLILLFALNLTLCALFKVKQ